MNRDLVRAHKLQSLVNSDAWFLVTEIMQEIVTEFSKDLIDCADDSQVLRLQHKTHAASKFVEAFQTRVNAGTRIEPADDNDFQTVSF